MSKYYTMHMGRTYNGGWEKTICFRQTQTENGWISEPVLSLDNTKGDVLEFISDVMQRADDE